MSYSKSNKMHCKVCESANKPMSIVTSHFPKNRDGFTVCPTLLSQECRYCNKKGHTTKYCSKKTKDEDNSWVLQQERKYANEKANEKANKKAAKLLLASFDALYESSDEEKEEEPIVEVKTESKRYMEAVMKAAAPPAKKEQKPKEQKPKEIKKINWATAESDSEGDESESDM
jgi:hypothetical protein